MAPQVGLEPTTLRLTVAVTMSSQYARICSYSHRISRLPSSLATDDYHGGIRFLIERGHKNRHSRNARVERPALGIDNCVQLGLRTTVPPIHMRIWAMHASNASTVNGS